MSLLRDESPTVEFGGGRPKAYLTSDGRRVAGVTTVLGRFKESGGLVGWAWKQGRDGIPLNEARDKAAGIGSAVHAMVEADIKGEDHEKALLDLCPHTADGPDLTFLEPARKAYVSYMDWWSVARLTITACEVPLVSDSMAVGGTVDAAMRHPSGALMLGDWKTSTSVYIDHYLQLCAYALLWEECRGEQVEGVYLFRFSKGGSFHWHAWPSRALLEPGKRMFRLLADAYAVERDCKAVM